MTSKADTKTAPPPVENEEVAEVTAPEPIWLGNNVPLFVISSLDEIDVIKQELGFQVFYILGSFREETKKPQYNNGPLITTYGPFEPRIYKVICNLVTQAIIAVPDTGNVNTMKLPEVDEKAWFLLPKMPYQLIDTIDTFFRAVDAKFGTESIVILTYDTRLRNTDDPSAGWGFVVPKQTNTAGHCKYEPTSVVDEIPDEDEEFVRQVGTAHSHPGMSAFASHTDHGDQANFDGLHLTFGWPHNGPTAYHIEMQCGGIAYQMRENQVITERPLEIPEGVAGKLEGWMDKVSKKEETLPKALPPTTGRTSTGTTHTHSSGGSATDRFQPKFDNHGVHFSPAIINMKMPAGIPHPYDNVVIVNLVDEWERKCPICQAVLTIDDVEARKCYDCNSFIRTSLDESMAEMVAARKKLGFTMARLEEPGDTPVIVLERWLEGKDIKTSQTRIHEGKQKK